MARLARIHGVVPMRECPHSASVFAGVMGLAGVMVLAGGCARRTIEVTSEPPGALVWMNDQEVGRTPLETDFKFFGTYDVRVALEGYEPVWMPARVDSPWFEKPGIDLLIAPVARTRTSARWHVTLTPSPESPAGMGRATEEPALLERARAARDGLGAQR